MRDFCVEGRNIRAYQAACAIIKVQVRWTEQIMYFKQHFIVIILCNLVLLGSALGQPPRTIDSDPGNTSFVLFEPGQEKWQGELKTAITTYQNESGIQLDLVATIHIADSDYFAELNQYFKGRDAVLYELVADADVRPSPDLIQSSSSSVGFLQQMLANFLGVAFQLEHIDYSPQNFIHADLDPASLAEIMQAKGENFLSMFISLALAEMANQQLDSATGASNSAFNLVSIMDAFSATDQRSAFKTLFAEELARSGGVLTDPSLGNQLTILGDRNRVALQVLRDTLRDSTRRRVSIFYGAAHMPGIEQEIVGQMGFTQVSQQWLTAWAIP
ncbi:MAG TPA: hypothetical protein QGI39_05175 [Gammaproteobacteria bacterium]|nr:hypothetical protein [Gammaproteobacteria bacterium]